MRRIRSDDIRSERIVSNDLSRLLGIRKNNKNRTNKPGDGGSEQKEKMKKYTAIVVHRSRFGIPGEDSAPDPFPVWGWAESEADFRNSFLKYTAFSDSHDIVSVQEGTHGTENYPVNETHNLYEHNGNALGIVAAALLVVILILTYI